jgi:hypothetical protein
MDQIKLRPLFTLRLEIEGQPQLIKDIPMGYSRRIVAIGGGQFAGDRLKGQVRRGGGDWVMMRHDGAMHLDVRIALETDAGELIYMFYNGRRNGSPAVLAKMTRNEDVSASEGYFRIIAQFETAAPGLLWLNDLIAVGTGVRLPNAVIYEVFEIL